jgi:hypothetical protein
MQIYGVHYAAAVIASSSFAGAEAGIAAAEGVFERVVQHGSAHFKERLHGHSVPAHLLLFVHALRHDLVDRTSTNTVEIDSRHRRRVRLPLRRR